MRTKFVISVLERILTTGVLNKNSSILAICAGEAERELFVNLGFTNVTLTSLDPSIVDHSGHPYVCALADAMRLPFENEDFDFVFVSDGLHHCDSPHGALIEMLRVSRVGILVIESRDNLCMRIGIKLGLVQRYELSAVIANNGTHGGVNYTDIPNFVYRWTEREFEKVVNCYLPWGASKFRYFYGLNIPNKRFNGMRGAFFSVSILFVKLFTLLFRKQGNTFAMMALRPNLSSGLFHWLRIDAGGVIKFKK